MFGGGGRKRMKLEMAGATHAGSARDHNEDAFGLDEELPAAVLADGMGGLSRGEVASATVVRSVLEGLRSGSTPEDAIRAAHRDILMDSKGSTQRMGATAVVLTVHDGQLRIHWVGDSRAYLLRGNDFHPVTRDHSLVQGLIDAGAITEREAESHPNRNVVTRAVGVEDSGHLEIDQVAPEVRAGDRLLICSDGLNGYLPQERIVSVMRGHNENQDAADALIAATLEETEAGDNISVICVTIA